MLCKVAGLIGVKGSCSRSGLCFFLFTCHKKEVEDRYISNVEDVRCHGDGCAVEIL